MHFKSRKWPKEVHMTRAHCYLACRERIMLAIDHESNSAAIGVKTQSAYDVVVVGSGPVGMRFVTELLSLSRDASVLVLGNEPVKPYDRIMLSSLVAGQVERESIDLALPNMLDHPNFEFRIANVLEIAAAEKYVSDSLGEKHYYSSLVLATGARPHVPNIDGIDLKGVYRFRTLADAEAISARVARSVHAVILGGGLLGLEAAKSLKRSGTKVTLIQQGSHLMNRQLDETAAALLKKEVEAQGIDVVLNSGVREILGGLRVEGVKTHDQQTISCDTVVVCAGISPNKELARAAGIKVGQGILVNDRLETSVEGIYAIGECCEHDGQIYGLVNPGYEQAAVAAHIVSRKQAAYPGSMLITRLKVLGQPVLSMGDVVDPAKRPRLSVLSYRDQKSGVYRKLSLLRGKLIGAMAYGEWPEALRVQSSFQNGFYIWPWQRLSFRLFGRLWWTQPSVSVQQWPEKAIVCNCRQVSKEKITACISRGCNTLEKVQAGCGASTVCGSCQPLVNDLLGSDVPVKAEKTAAWLFGGSVLAFALVALLVFSGGMEVSDSVQTKDWFESIWNDKFWKQVTGFSLLGMSVVGMLMSLRKRYELKWMGGFASWRVTHTTLGALCLMLLVLHTGMHLGSNLNFLLIMNFLALAMIGGLTGLVVALGHRLKASSAQKLRQFWTWMHILLSWPLPALLAAHIMSVYYF